MFQKISEAGRFKPQNKHKQAIFEAKILKQHNLYIHPNHKNNHERC